MLLISKASSVLPSSTTTDPSSRYALDTFSHSMPAAKRPKLSLQTSALPSAHYGTAGSNTGNARLMDMATATPTTLNTFNNTFDLSIRPSPISSIAPPSALSKPLTTTSSRPKRQAAGTYELNLPLGIRPILKNSSLPPDLRRGSLSAAASASPLSAVSSSRRVFFPEPKRVKFAVGGDEEVVNRVYTRRHMDISSSEDEESSSGSGEEGEESGPPSEAPTVGDDDAVAEEPQERAAALRLSSKTAENVDEVQRGRSQSRHHRRSSNDATRKTRKRRRWEWTLGSTATGEAETAGATEPRPTTGKSLSRDSAADDAAKDGAVEVAVEEVQATPSPADVNAETPSPS
ncbi:uncharacterized protein AB675_10650 [Cyphellophora attinorum]|uniref:Uncharacterized protein n=1 Tax=Cyphellophora attinorum TaxID=1664694 RepID=A0A0N0NMM1_9EURO|nr:uncharacterized protein AB675_10650 [Phialophora attinorum]KPI40621.1 hypothetical protein AB675_10650 [Phialophora attinorum]